jgi:alpha-N-arabinofuranosidase
MDAQILRNPTFAWFPFWNGQMSPDGVTLFQVDREKINQDLHRRAILLGWPETELNRLSEAYQDGLACWWTRVGPRDEVVCSPDTAPHGQRAQRVEVQKAGQGIAQWTYLPLHRIRKYEYQLFLRSPNLKTLTVALTTGQVDKPLATAVVRGVTTGWQQFQGVLEVGTNQPGNQPWQLSLTAEEPGQIVLGRILLRPADHAQGADPDVVRLLRESRLPLLRWPGGNFASTYHWKDGVGPVEQRPTRPNLAWGGVETHHFGTAEFIAFCRAVGCEPMICINAGNGTAEEAALWIEYCNGPATSPMGRLRESHGQREPFRVRYWEVGNELWGRWQCHWTTASGYVDRYQQFAQAMRAADPSIHLLACGAPVLWGKAWNDTLIAGTTPILETITDHSLIGGTVSVQTDPLDVFRDFMAVPRVLEKRWSALRADMTRAGVRQPRLAVTELQMFAQLGRGTDSGKQGRLNRDNLVNPATLGEALYDVLILHAGVRLAPFVGMVTHSATVNHGGGLRKERERVYANPCHYAQATFADLAGATPVKTDLEVATEQAPLVLAQLKSTVKEASYPAVDALAALGPKGDLWISLVHCVGAHSTRMRIEVQDFPAGKLAEVRLLGGDIPWAANTLTQPDRIKPRDSTMEINKGLLMLELPPYSVLRVRLPRGS